MLLGFVPDGQEDAVKSGDSMRVISETYTKLMAGGGAANIDVNAVFTDLQDLTSEYGALFQIPPYFAYIGKHPRRRELVALVASCELVSSCTCRTGAGGVVRVCAGAGAGF